MKGRLDLAAAFLRRFHFVFAALFFTAATAAVHWPVVIAPSEKLIGGYTVGALYSWMYWWWPFALRHGMSLLHSNFLMYPDGAALFFISPVNDLAAILLRPMISPYAVVNALLLAQQALAGFSAYILLYRLSRDKAAALCGAFAYAFSFYMLVQQRHAHLMDTTLLFQPFFVWSLLRFKERPGLRSGGIAAGALLGICWSSPYMAYCFGAVFVVGALIYDAAAEKGAHARLFFRHARGGTGLCLAAVVMLVGLAYWPIFRHAGEWEGGGLRFYNYLISFINPPYWHTASWVRGLMTLKEPYVGEEIMGYPGLGAAILIFYGFARRLPRAVPAFRFWSWILLWAAVLSLGPRLKISPDWVTSIPLPYALAESLPALRDLRTVSRIWVTGTLAVAVLAAFGFREATRRFDPRWRVLAATAFIGFWWWEFDLGQIRHWYFSTRPPAVYTLMKNDPSPGALLELPIGYDQRMDITPIGYVYMLFQTHHERPMVLGVPARHLPLSLDFTEETPFVRELVHPWILRRLEEDPSQADRSRWLIQNGRRCLKEAGILYVLYHPQVKAFIEEEAQADLRLWLDKALGPPVMEEGGRHILYKVE